MRAPLRGVLVLAVFVAVAGGAALPAAAGRATVRPLPRRVYAPYFETWTTNRIPAVARRASVRRFTLAFLEAPARGSCSPAWNGNPRQTLASGRYVAQIAELRDMGGDVVPSFGGYSADHALRDIADACPDVRRLAAAYEAVLTTYGVARLDLDVEDRSLGHAAGIDRRNRALRLVERWAARRGRPLQISYTLPVSPGGLDADALRVLRNAVAHGTRVDVVNLMAFDYYDGTTTDMGGAAIAAARAVHRQLRALHPAARDARLWHTIGLTLLPGIDDYPRKTEVTHLADARRVERFAAHAGLGTLSIWAIQRDNGGCPGVIDSNACSGIVQRPWAFSHVLRRFTRR
jgi:glycosyl hydrolase family 18 (putative chitinase)